MYQVLVSPSAQTPSITTEISSVAAVEYHEYVRMSIVEQAFGMIPHHRVVGVVTMGF
jgi:hypothetical protein